MAITSGILLAIYIVAIVLVINWPTRRRHPEDAQAVGCLTFIALGCADGWHLVPGGAFSTQLAGLHYLRPHRLSRPVRAAATGVERVEIIEGQDRREGKANSGRGIDQSPRRTTHVFHRRSLIPTVNTTS